MAALGRWIRRIILIAIALVIVAAGWFVWRLYASLPMTEGEIALEGLSEPAYIVRDANAVPHIFASDANAAAYALGVAHAQDRLWQMHFTRAAVRGQLAAMLGPDAVANDARMRIYGLAAASDDLAARLPEDDRAYFQAYADGVNAFMASDGFSRPPEFLLLQTRPQPWTVADTILIYKAIALDLVTGEAMRAAPRARLTSVLGQARTRAFLPPYPEDGVRALSEDEVNYSGEAADTAIEVEAGRDPMGEEPEGSNNWVVSGQHTTSGSPLLANDPHLGHRTPGVWYLARMTTPQGSQVGATLPGAPNIVLGHNGRIAWGFTNTGTDVMDIVTAEEAGLDLVSEDTETIRVKGEEPVELKIRKTADGVVLPRDWFDAAQIQPLDTAAILVSPLDDPDDFTSTVGRRISSAESWDDLNAALRNFVVPMQNIVFADTAGNIGFITPGRAPLRDESGAWTGQIPFEDLPRTYNPEDGMVVTANNQIPPDGYPYFLTESWSPPFRAARITDLLTADRRLDKADFRAIQTDVVSGWATDALPHLWEARPESANGQESLRRLRGWNGEMRRGWPEPLIFAEWMKELSRAIYEDDLGEAFIVYHRPREQFIVNVLSGEAPGWCDDSRTELRESCTDIAGPALDRAVAVLAEQYGPDLENWSWGEAHPAYFAHYPFAASSFLDRIFSTRVPAPGDGTTVNVAHYSYSREDFRAFHGASYRAIYDLADLNESQFISPVGQSGHFLSKHYRDLAEPWADGEYFEIRYDWTPQNAPESTETLVLRPAR